MLETTIIGIDCATNDSKVGLSLALANDDECVVRFARLCTGERQLAQVVEECLTDVARVLIALDAPLGWPRPMGHALGTHKAGAVIDVAANHLFRRATDHFIKSKFSKQSLDVGADRIARTSHSALRLLGDLRDRSGQPIPLAWEPSYGERIAAIEVYPAVTLIGYGIPASGYKQSKKEECIAARRAIIDSIARHIRLPEDKSPMELSADALDAAVCALAGYDFLRGHAFLPEDPELARHEGWIWVRPKPTPTELARS